jgi:hypothetical protein
MKNNEKFPYQEHKMTKAKQYVQFVLYANYLDHKVMNETVEEKIGYAIQVYWGKFPVFHRIVETDLITF